MKKRIFIPIIILALLLTACSEGAESKPEKKRKTEKKNEPEEEIYIEDQIFYEDELNVDLVIFAAGGRFFILKSGEKEWEMLVSDDTGDIYLDEFEFEEATADLTLLTGGEAGHYKDPTIKKVIEHHSVSFADVAERGLIEEYDPEAEEFYGPRICRTEEHTFCIVRVAYKKYCLYRDCEYVGTYETAKEAGAAMGIEN